jgi:hypothetical protein
MTVLPGRSRCSAGARPDCKNALLRGAASSSARRRSSSGSAAGVVIAGVATDWPRLPE